MIPAVLPPPRPDVRAETRSAGDDGRFDDTLRHIAEAPGTDRPSRGPRGRQRDGEVHEVHERPDDGSADRASDTDRHVDRATAGDASHEAGSDSATEEVDQHRDRDEPGEDGRARAAAAMPADVRAHAVVAGTAHDARPVEGTDDAAATAEPVDDEGATNGLTGDLVERADAATSVDGEEQPTTLEAEPAADELLDTGDTTDVGNDHEPGIEGEPVEISGDAEIDATADEPAADADGGELAHRVDAEDLRDTADRRDGTTRAGRAAAGAARAAAVGRAAAEAGRVDADVPATAPQAESVGRADLATAPAPTAATGAHATATPAPPAPPPPVAQQLVEHVSPLVDQGDGTHDLTIELRPASLGRVQLEVTLEDGLLHVRVHADDPGSRRLLAQSLGELRTALTDAGISSGNLDVGDPRGDDHPRGDGGPAGGAPGRGSDVERAVPASARPRPSIDGRAALDVLL